MSSASSAAREELLHEFVREARQFNELGASYIRAVAGRGGINVTDLQVTDILDITGPTSAGQLAELTGLTTGAITQMLDRLEKDGFVSRERDPADGRRVIVRLTPSEDAMRKIAPLFESVGQTWGQVAADYDDEQLAFLLAFLKRSNALSRQELARLREAPQDEPGIFSAPLAGLTSARLVIPAGVSHLTLRADSGLTELFQARFEGAVPEVKTSDDGVVSVRFPRRLWMLGGGQGKAEIILSGAIPWQIVIQGGASEITAVLGNLDLVGLQVKGGLSTIHLELPVPSRAVPVRISGGASMITVQRPVGVPARVHLKGWTSTFVFDEQTFSNVGNDVRLHSPGYQATAPGYDIDVSSSASMVTITAE